MTAIENAFDFGTRLSASFMQAVLTGDEDAKAGIKQDVKKLSRLFAQSRAEMINAFNTGSRNAKTRSEKRYYKTMKKPFYQNMIKIAKDHAHYTASLRRMITSA